MSLVKRSIFGVTGAGSGIFLQKMESGGLCFWQLLFFELLRQIRLSSLIHFELDVRSFVWVYRVYRFSVFQTYYFARPIAVGGLGRYSLSFFLNRPKKMETDP